MAIQVETRDCMALNDADLDKFNLFQQPSAAFEHLDLCYLL